MEAAHSVPVGQWFGGLALGVVCLFFVVLKTKQPSCLRWALMRCVCKLCCHRMKSQEFRKKMTQEVQELVRTQVTTGKVPEGGVCFIGSSAWRLWGHDALRSDMAPLPVYNMGFGGSMMEDVLAHSDALILDHKPRLIVYYTGVNNINAGDGADVVVEGFQHFVARVRAASKSVTIAFVAINQSLLHQHVLHTLELDREVNTRTRSLCDRDPTLEFLDPWSQDPRLQSDDSLYKIDGLHFNREGYEVLTAALRPLLLPVWERAKDNRW